MVAAPLGHVAHRARLTGAAPASCDIAIVGGGPAGLATAIVAAQQGFSVQVIERRDYPPDKACGEGLLPPGVQALRRLGVLDSLDSSSFYPFAGVRFIQEDRSSLECRLPRGGGLGIRRTVLIEALTRRAEQFGVVFRHRCDVAGAKFAAGESTLQTASGSIAARLVVAADGLHSPLRRAAGLEAPSRLPRRYALRQHFNVAPWTDLVEMYIDGKGEAVATPVSSNMVGVNFTWSDGMVARPGIESLASRFPVLHARLGNDSASNRPMGAGPMGRLVKRRTSNGLVLMGDAAGFVDSIAGDGLSIAFNSALVLGTHLPDVLKQGATRASLAGYEKAARRLFRGYWTVTNAMLWLARHPGVRGTTIRFLSKRARIIDKVVDVGMTMMSTA